MIGGSKVFAAFDRQKSLIMLFDPTDYKTWTRFNDHPIFGEAKHRISEWSHDPSLYDDLDSYGQFNADWYVHIDPRLPTEEQQRIADHDIKNFANATLLIEKNFGFIRYELAILDDLTVYIEIEHKLFLVEIYSSHFSDNNAILFLYIESPDVPEGEHHCQSVTEMIEIISTAISD